MVAQAAADTISKLLNAENLMPSMNELLYGDNAQPMRTTTAISSSEAEGANLAHPLDGQLLAEALEYSQCVPSFGGPKHVPVPRSQYDAMIRCVRIATDTPIF